MSWIEIGALIVATLFAGSWALVGYAATVRARRIFELELRRMHDLQAPKSEADLAPKNTRHPVAH